VQGDRLVAAVGRPEEHHLGPSPVRWRRTPIERDRPKLIAPDAVRRGFLVRKEELPVPVLLNGDVVLSCRFPFRWLGQQVRWEEEQGERGEAGSESRPEIPSSVPPHAVTLATVTVAMDSGRQPGPALQN
jgi:hypothetical protein